VLYGFYTEWCPWLLQALGPSHLSVALEELSLDLPLKFCINNVPDGFYWQRRAVAMWPDPDHGVSVNLNVRHGKHQLCKYILDCPDQNKLCSIEFPMLLPCFDMDILISSWYL
jgi:hypothetical protein